jgi:hypothetical protein
MANPRVIASPQKGIPVEIHAPGSQANTTAVLRTGVMQISVASSELKRIGLRQVA